MMRVLVCGGRSFTDRESLFHELHKLAEQYGHLTVIEGGAKGADALAREWATLGYHGLVTVRAEWHRLGRAAGPMRNTRMLVGGKPDMVLAFPGGRGTADMVCQAREVGVPVVEIPARQSVESAA
jgi:predicted Rossmann-fold nucleotide-binding protein